VAVSGMVGRTPIDLGYFNTEIAAAFAYDDAAFKVHGPFARLNFAETEPTWCSIGRRPSGLSSLGRSSFCRTPRSGVSFFPPLAPTNCVHREEEDLEREQIVELSVQL